MKFVFNYPETSGLESDLLDSGEISDVAVAVEAAGFDAFALTEHPIPGANWLAHGGHQTLDPFVGLAFAAAVTERIQLLTAPVGGAVPESVPAGQDRGHARPAARTAASSSGSAPATTRPSSSPSASTSTSATRCSTRHSSSCRRRGRAIPSTQAGSTSPPRA